MSKFTESLSEVEINFGPSPHQDFSFKVDGKELKGVRNVEIVSGVSVGVPIIQVELYAKRIKGKVKGKVEVKQVK